jgi:biopolymer transport protein ExbB
MEGVTEFITEFFKVGGIIAWGITICLGLTFTVLIERVVVLYFTAGTNSNNFIRGIEGAILSGALDKVARQCQTQNFPLSRIIHAGVSKATKSDEEVQAAMDEAALRELPRIEKRTGYLAMLANVATLLGLLGTIKGMIASFSSAGGGSSDKAAALAEGISEALHCTFMGLFVAVISLLAFSILQGRTQGLVDDIHEGAVRVMNMIVSNRNLMKTGGEKAA